MSEIVRIVIIEDDDTIREGYSFFINQEDAYEVVNSYASAEEALKKIQADNPDVVVLDIELPGLSGIEALPRIKKLLPKAYVLMLTVYDSEKNVFDALAQGASGYITKDSSPAKIVSAIREVYEGGGPMSVNIARIVIKSFQRNQDSPLSKRETQILELVAIGKSRSQIANDLFIDLETVRSHIKNIYLKLDVNSRADALKVAKDNRLI